VGDRKKITIKDMIEICAKHGKYKTSFTMYSVRKVLTNVSSGFYRKEEKNHKGKKNEEKAERQ
jgi:hypothetical protein